MKKVKQLRSGLVCFFYVIEGTIKSINKNQAEQLKEMFQDDEIVTNGCKHINAFKTSSDYLGYAITVAIVTLNALF